ncbi:hypothetical protein ACFU99_26795 [Streptomyces sp. NPDC057654]|uniref:hypothetical protein n=1 Tax=Streptomyces sp. NPDC057654 TaxID=3346196 RepID=UPI0036C1CFDA
MGRVTTQLVVDLRRQPVDDVLNRVEQGFGTRLKRSTMVRKRRSVGVRTDRGTWVRVERRAAGRIDGQGWNGTEVADSLTGIAMPQWLAGLAWRAPDGTAVWRADETTLLPDVPVRPEGGTITVAPELADSWWRTLNSSLDALARAKTTRVATPDTVTITQEGITSLITHVFGAVVDTAVDRWHPAHADLNWANVTGPTCCIFDWEDWGAAPRGLDAASLWAASLAVPDLAERVRNERRADLESRDGRLMMLFACAKIAGPCADAADPKLEPARTAARQLIAGLW